MICSRCGLPLPPGTSICARCDAPGIAPMKTSGSGWGGAAPAWAPAPAVAAGAPEYAGFWLRLLAYLIDSFAIGISGVFFSVFLGVVLGILGAASGSGSPGPAGAAAGPLVMLVAPWLYFALMESSAKQATLGKMALGLAVTDDLGGRIGFGRATGRYFGKLLSWIPLGIGFVLAGFTDRKRALHDMVAGTLVVRRGKAGAGAIAAVVVAGAFGGVVILGILAAIAIPNFLRYQLRSKATEGPTILANLVAAELHAQQATGRFVALSLPSGGAPGTAKLAWSAEDLAVAQALGLAPESATYYRYSFAVAPAEGGRESFSACAESDLDGDGVYAAYVLWQPAVNEAGNPVGEPPAPPCAHAPKLERSLSLEPGDPTGQPVRVSPPNVF